MGLDLHQVSVAHGRETAISRPRPSLGLRCVTPPPRRGHPPPSPPSPSGSQPANASCAPSPCCSSSAAYRWPPTHAPCNTPITASVWEIVAFPAKADHAVTASPCALATFVLFPAW